MRLALITPNFAPDVGGIERFVLDLAQWMAQDGHDVTVVTRTAGPDPEDQIRPYAVVRSGDVGSMRRAASRADAVHVKCLWGRAVLAAVSAARRPLVTHAHHQAICPVQTAWGRDGGCDATGTSPGPCGECWRRDARARLDLRLQRLAMREAAANVCVSEYLAGRLRPPRPRMIYNPVGRPSFETNLGPLPDRPLVAFAGRLSPPKGGTLLLEAIRLLPDVELEIAGDGPERSALERRAQDLGLTGRVRFLGYQTLTQVLELYSRSSLVCMPSVWEEPFGYATAEAMALGRPVVATPSGALPELLAEGRGFVAADRTAAGLAEALKVALGDRSARVEAAARARSFAAENLHIDVVAPRYVTEYEALRR